jgi:hypothetical protein
VISTLTPSAVKRAMFCCSDGGTWPTTRWPSKPTASIGTLLAFRDLTSSSIAVLLAPTPSMS